MLITYKVNKHPQGKVYQRIDCGWPCRGAQNVTDVFANATIGEWNKTAINLACFVEAGADLTKVDIPFLLTTNEAFSITIKEVRIDKTEHSEQGSCYPLTSGSGF